MASVMIEFDLSFVLLITCQVEHFPSSLYLFHISIWENIFLKKQIDGD